eukprot:scaffold8470_cov48-Phaeocystis_antarctica.AAC.2
MKVSLNAQQYTPTPMAFFPAPSTAALSPTSGPLLGGTNISNPNPNPSPDSNPHPNPHPHPTPNPNPNQEAPTSPSRPPRCPLPSPRRRSAPWGPT